MMRKAGSLVEWLYRRGNLGWKALAWCIVAVWASLVLPGCRGTWAAERAAGSVAGDASTLRYLIEPAEGARDVQGAPTVRWDRQRLQQELGVPARVELQVRSLEGELVYSATSQPEPAASWLVKANSLRLFSRPPETTMRCDPRYTTATRLQPGQRYQVALIIDTAGSPSRRIIETVTFTTALDTSQSAR